MRPFARYLVICAVWLLVVPLIAYAQSESDNFAALFAYDQTPPVITEISVEDRNGVTVHDITFDSPVTGEPISAYLVVPPGEGPFPGILYVHWLGAPGTTNRTEFLNEAVQMAGEGVVSLLPNAMWSQSGWFRQRDSAQDFSASIEQVINLRRAIDVLQAQSNVDLERLAYVGHDFGAMYGATLSAADDRIEDYVFIAGTDQFMDWFMLSNHLSGPDLLAMTEAFTAIDPITIFDQHLPRNTFFQFAETDQYVRADVQTGLYLAARMSHRRIATYDDTHAMSTPIVRNDRMDWLHTQLQLSPVE